MARRRNKLVVLEKIPSRRSIKSRAGPRPVRVPLPNFKKKNTQANGKPVVPRGPKRTPPAFGNTKRTRNFRLAFNALSNAHIPLPRQTGPYSVFSMSKVITTTDVVGIFGFFKVRQSGAGAAIAGDAPSITNVCAVTSVASGTAVGAASNARSWGVDFSGLGVATTISPYAYTVQINCGTAIGSATGLVSFVQNMSELQLGGTARTWDTFAQQMQSGARMRTCSAGEIAWRGKMSHGVPIDPSDMEAFYGHIHHSDSTFTWNEGGDGNWTNHICPMATSQLVVYNPSGATLTYTITLQYRLRYDISDPSYSTHTTHAASTDGEWAAGVAGLIAWARRTGGVEQAVVAGAEDVAEGAIFAV